MMTARKKVPKLPSVKRLPSYLHELKLLRDNGQEVVSTTLLAQRLSLEPIVVRKDLELAGSSGSPGIGYRIQNLIEGIEGFLGWKNATPVFLVGAGSLGTALLGYHGFAEYGFHIVAAFDTDLSKIGTSIHDKPVFGMDHLANLVERMKVRIAFLCVPCEQAQRAAEQIVAAGIVAIWNFTNTPLSVPHDIVQQKVNLAGDLAELSVRLSGRLGNDAPGL